MKQGTARFLTFSCYRRLPLFQNDGIKTYFVEHLVDVSARLNVRTVAWVIMPEHVHLLMLPAGGGSVTPFLAALQRPIAKEVIGRWKGHGLAYQTVAPKILEPSTDARGHAHLWQAGGGYDRNVYGAELIEKIRYIHANPIRRGLTATSVDWPWSSARRFVGRDDAIGPNIATELIPDHSGELT